MKFTNEASLQMQLVLRELNAYFANGTPVHADTMYSENETFAQAVKRVLQSTATKLGLEARRKSWCGSFAGFRIFQDGKMVINHINALREEEALTKAKEYLDRKAQAVA